MSNRELPMMPWFPQDFASATSAWTALERSLYRELLDAQWILGKLPVDNSRLARIAHFELETFEEAWPIVSTKFENVNGCFLNKRLEEHRATAEAYVEQRRNAGRAGGLARAKRESSGATPPAQARVKHPSPSPSPSPILREDLTPPNPPLQTQGGNGVAKATPGRKPRPIRMASREAWSLVLTAAQGGANSVGQPLIDEAVRQIGGYQRLSQAHVSQRTINRDRFRDAYETLLDKQPP